MDTLTPEERSLVMAKVKGKNTRPEIFVRKQLHAMGYRFRLHADDLPGKPDIVFRSRKKVIFVHGCFWDRHDDCAMARMPKSRVDFWNAKLSGNKKRDAEKFLSLKKLGWDVLVIWECELSDIQSLRNGLATFLESAENAVD